MIHDSEYRLNEQDAVRILRLIGHLKEAVAALLEHRHNSLPLEELDDIPSASELIFSELAYNIRSSRIP